MKKTTSWLLVSIISMITLPAYGRTEIAIWPDGAAPEGNGLTNDGHTGTPGFVMEVTKPVMTVFPAAEPNGTAILMLPGGGYMGAAMLHEGTDMAGWFNSQGITYAVLMYRVPNGHSRVPLDDVEQAMRLLRENAAGWGIDKDKIGIMGASAGGHLAATLAMHHSSEETRPAFQVLMYPVISMDGSITHQGSCKALLGENPTEEAVRHYSNELQVTPQSPKAFIMVSGDDDTVDVENSLRYFKALTDRGVSCSLHVYPTGGHGWGFRDKFPYKRDWMTELEDWLAREVTGK